MTSSPRGPLPGSCEDASECRLANDCCACEAVHVDEQVASCDLACERPLCDLWGTTEVICSHTCRVRLVECDPALVECTDQPPTCDEGFLPSVESRCWTHRCVPMELCVPF